MKESYGEVETHHTITDVSGARTLDYAADGQTVAETLAFNTSLFTLHEKIGASGFSVAFPIG